MEVEIENDQKMSPKHYVWGVVICNVLGSTLFLGYWDARYRNCSLVECSGFDAAAIFFGALGLVLSYIHWNKNKEMTGLAKSTLVGLALIALAVLTHGLGIGPGDVCPTIDPQC